MANVGVELEGALDTYLGAKKSVLEAQYTLRITQQQLGKALKASVERDFDIVFPIIVDMLMKYPGVLQNVVNRVLRQYDIP